MATVDPQYQQQVAPGAVPVGMQPALQPAGAPGATVPVEHHEEELLPLRIYGHSGFFYWWPVWAVGYIMAILTGVYGESVSIGGHEELFLASKNPGVIYTVVFFLIILLTNVTVRGLASVVVVMGIVLTTVVFAYFGWWDIVLQWVPHLSIHMNMGFYVFFSTLIFIMWAFSTFVYDRMSYWQIKPGQITEEYVIGGAAKSWDTRGMVFEKHRQDLFRNWILGFGTGDLKILTTGAKREELNVQNVVFVDSKVLEIQKMIAMRPNQFVSTPNS